MKTYSFSSKKLSIYSLFGFLSIMVTSCGSYQNSSYYDSDGVYGNFEKILLLIFKKIITYYSLRQKLKLSLLSSGEFQSERSTIANYIKNSEGYSIDLNMWEKSMNSDSSVASILNKQEISETDVLVIILGDKIHRFIIEGFDIALKSNKTNNTLFN